MSHWYDSALMPSLRRVLVRVQPLLLLAGFGFMGVLLSRQWDSLRAFDWQLELDWLALSGLCLVAGWLIDIGLWRRILGLLGGHLDLPDAINIFVASSIVRYVPGSIWQPLNMTVLCQARQIRPEVTLASTFLLHFVHLLAAAAIAAIYLAIWGAPGETAAVLGQPSEAWALLMALPVVGFVVWPRPVLSLGNYFLVKSGRTPLPLKLSSFNLATLVGGSATVWLAFCIAFATLARALGVLTEISSWTIVPHLAAAYPVAWAVGFLSLLTPSGLVVREGILVLLLTPLLGRGQALVIALAMRVWEVGLEIVVGGSIVGFERFSRAARASIPREEPRQ